MILHLVSSTCVTYAYKGCFCDIFPLLSSLFSAKILFSRIFLRRDSLNSKMQYKTVRVWHATTASPVLTYTGHDNHQNLSSTVLSVTWSPDSKHIASAGQDVTVQIWEALSGKRISTYRGYNANVYAALWSLNSQYIASGGDDGTVQVWQAV